MRTLLVLRALGLGDLLVAVPALRALRRRYPAHRVALAASAALDPLARATGAVDETLPTTGPDVLFWADRPAPDIAVNLHGVGPQSHRALDGTRPRQRIGLRAPGWDGPDWADIARVHPHERERWCAVVEAFGVCADPTDFTLDGRAPGAGGHVVVHPGAAFGAKRWPVDRFALVAARLAAEGHRVVVTGSREEVSLARDVAQRAGLAADRVLAGRTDIAGLVDVVARAAAVVCGDTGIAHVATALRTPSVVLTDADRRRGDPFADDPDPALLGVDVDEVTHVLKALLAEQPVTR
jgi:ADP-heptose:LPS heptosyltransferase